MKLEYLFLDMVGENMGAAATVTRVPVIAGQDADLPCDTQPSRKNDSLLFVVWYRDDSPVYSFDAREPASSAHWAEEPYVGRTFWYHSSTPGLKILNVQARDRAVYTCRVDFHASPARNYRIALDVVEPPGQPVIFDEFGNQILDIAGPFHEGGKFKLVCTVKGGYPTPRIQWIQNATVVKSLRSEDFQSPASESRTLVLEVENATREVIDTEYTCTADNNLDIHPQKSTARVDLYLKPLTAEILSRNQPLSIGRNAEILCRTKGSKPSAVVTWLLGEKKLNATTRQSVSEGTESILEWTPLKEHNGQVLTCKVENPNFSFPILESELLLNINYVPEPSIQFGTKTTPDDIEEGDDVYLACQVDANPPAYKVVWEHNGILIRDNATASLLAQSTELKIEKVSRQQAGVYACIASNVEGDGKSTDLDIRVNYRPVCQTEGFKTMGSALQEPVNIVCQVDAYPPPTNFKWSLNSTSGAIEVDPSRFTIESKEGKSVLTFTPVSDIDYGTLSCRAFNRVGQQEVPCLYTLLPAMKPDPPANCTVYNLTHDSLDLLCTPGFEGGLQCIYVVEVWASDGLVVNASSDVPHWNLRRLGANRPLRLVMYAANARGRSEHVTFAVTTHHKKRPPPELPDMMEWTLNWSVGVFLTVVLLILIILCLALVATRVCRSSRDYEVNLNTLSNEKIIVPKQKTLQSHPEDKHPDLIQSSKGTANCTSPPPLYSAITSMALHDPHHRKEMYRKDTQFPQQFQNELARNMKGPPYKREIVTTKSQLISPHQESRV